MPHSTEQKTNGTVDSGDPSPSPWSSQEILAFCNAYWYPLYAFLRRSGKSPPKADELIQNFFQRLMEGDLPAHAATHHRKIRIYLHGHVRTLLAEGEGYSPLESIPTMTPLSWQEESYAKEPAHLDADHLFQRRWAMTILDFTLQILRWEFTKEGKTSEFEIMAIHLGFRSDPEEEYLKTSARLEIALPTLKHKVFLMRCRWRELLLEQITQTIHTPTQEEINGELMELLSSV